MIPIIQPTLRSGNSSSGFKESPQQEKVQSTPKYVLKVPIPNLQTLQGVSSHPIVPSFSDSKSGHKENNFSAVTFDQKQQITLSRKWNPEGSDKGVLSHSAKKINTENEESSIVEKSFTEAAQKILKIKNLELENKVSLLIIENERLTTFLNDQFQENEKLTNELQNCQQNLEDLSKHYEDKLNVVLLENDKLISINQTLEMKNETLSQQLKKLSSEKDEEIRKARNEWAGKYQQQMNNIDEKRRTELNQESHRFDQLQFEKSELQSLISEQQNMLMQFQIDSKIKDTALMEFETVKADLASKVHKIEMMSQTIVSQEQRVKDLENRLDIMVADNKQLHDVNEQLNSTQRILQSTMEDRQLEFDREQRKSKDFYEQELKIMTAKNKQQIDEIKCMHQEQLQIQTTKIENELMKEFDQLKFELETKQNELNNNLLLWQEKEKNLMIENNKERQIKDEMIQTLKLSNQSVIEQMNQLQSLIAKMQEDFDSQYSKKESECVKMAKTLHNKEQALKQTTLRLEEMTKQIKMLEEQRDECKQQAQEFEEKVKNMEMKLDILVKENDTLENQLKINESQLKLSEQKYESLEKNTDQKLEDLKLSYSLEVQAQIEQCITQYQQTIKYEQDHSEQVMKNLKKQQEKAKHYELLHEQQLNDMEKQNKRIEELLDVCESNTQKMIQFERLLRDRDFEVENLNNRLAQIGENYELQIETLKKQMYDMGIQNEDLAQDFNQTTDNLSSMLFNYLEMEDQRKKILGDLAEVTKQKIDSESQLRKLKAQMQGIEEENKKNSEDAIKFRNQVYQYQQEIEEITRSLQNNYSDKEAELQHRFEGTITELKQQLNTITAKYNELARKERDNRFRLKLLKTQTKLPSELEEDNCYDTIKRKMEDQAQYLQRLILENDELKQQQYSHICKQPQEQKQKSQRQSLNVIRDYTTQDTDRTNDYFPIKPVVPNKQQPVKIIPQMNRTQNIMDSKGGSNRVIERDVYLHQHQNNRTEPLLYRKQSLQRF